MTKIISIISKGHSGSTLCDILTGSLPRVFSTGECVYFPWQLSRNGGMCELGQDFCSCGAKFSECNIWSKVIGSISQRVGFDILESPYHFPMAMYKNQIYRQPMTKVDRIMRGILSRMLQYFPPPTPLMRIFTNHVDRQLANN